MTVNGTVNATDFVSNGVTAVNPGGVLNNSGSDLVFGGGSVTSVGVYNPSNGQVTPGGTISLGATNLVVRGGLVRNNGTVTSTTGNIVIDFGGVYRGTGVNDVNAIVKVNGGVQLSGNSPGLSPNRNVDFTTPSNGVLASDMSNVTGTAGSGDPAGFSGWGVYEYGATSLANGRATITGTAANRAVFRMATVTDAPPRNAPSNGLVTNFDPAQAYSWVILRPGTAAGFNAGTPPAVYTDFTTLNTVAQINIFDVGTSANVPLTVANLNAYLQFDASQWDFGPTPVGQRGAFAFAFLPDSLGTLNRIIALTYTPVPEPAAVLGLCAAAGAIGGWVRRRRARADA